MYESDPVFQPIRIGNRTIENRFAIQSMEANDADSEGNPTERTYERYRRYFEGEAGLIDLEAITITDDSVSRNLQLSLLPRNQKALGKFVREMKAVNEKALFVFQITHAGQLSDPGFSRRVTVKPLPAFGGDLLTEDDVDRIIDRFVLGAKIAHDVGADGLDVKCCHGYLGSEITRPYNDRNWKYGGAFENRARFVFSIYERIDREINDPDFIVGSKVSFWEGFPGGQGTTGPRSPILDLSETIRLIKGMEERGARFIIVSAGGPCASSALMLPDRTTPEHVYLHFTFQKAARDVLKPETVVIGSAYSILGAPTNTLPALTDEENTLLYWANRNIEEGITDMIALGRQALADPQIPLKLRAGREGEINWCIACNNCLKLLLGQQNVGCVTFNPVYAKLLKEMRARKRRPRFKRT